MMEFELALNINLALFAFYSAVLVAISIDDAKKEKNGNALQSKKAA